MLRPRRLRSRAPSPKSASCCGPRLRGRRCSALMDWFAVRMQDLDIDRPECHPTCMRLQADEARTQVLIGARLTSIAVDVGERGHFLVIDPHGIDLVDGRDLDAVPAPSGR